jgi:PmbA protein
MTGGSSPLNGRVGSAVVSREVSIADMPLLDCGGASAPFDAEGSATYDKPLFEKGVFRGFVFDLVTAREAGTTTTGNAGRNLDRRPEPVCTNLVMKPGRESLEEIISGMDSGIVVSDILSGEGSNASTGDFSFDSCNAFRVENGEVTGRIPGAHIRGNVYSVLSGVTMLERELTPAGSDLFPAVLAGGVSISQ